MISSEEGRYYGDTELDRFGRMLARFSIIDLGIITKVSNRFATVQTFRTLNGERIIYDNVEVLYLGTAGSALTAEVSGSLCLVFRPLTSIEDCTTFHIVSGATPYSRTGMKCLAISTGINSIIRTGYDMTGSYSISGTGYNFIFNKNDLQLTINDSVVLSFNNTGNNTVLNTVKIDEVVYTVYTDTSGHIVHITYWDGQQYIQYHKPQTDVSDPLHPTSVSWDTVLTYGESLTLKKGNCEISITSSEVTINNHLRVGV